MKGKFLFLIVVLTQVLMLNFSYAQTKKPLKKNTAKKEVSQSVAKHGSSEIAGKYAKNFANKMYNTEPVYGDSHRGLNVDILDWDALQDDNGKWWYGIRLNLAWEEGIGRWDWKKVNYSGVLMTDDYGCNSSYIIIEKTEPSILGLIKRVGKLSDQQREMFEAFGPWFQGAKYVWSPSGCLD